MPFGILSLLIRKVLRKFLCISRKNVIELDVFFQQMNHLVVEQTPARTVRDIYSKSLISLATFVVDF